MVPALILVLATWCPTTTTSSDRPRCCPCEATTTSTATSTTSTTSTTEPRLVIEPPHLVLPTAPTTTTTVPAIVDATTITRPSPVRELPVTGPDGETIVVAGLLVMLGGLFVAARPKNRPPP